MACTINSNSPRFDSLLIDHYIVIHSYMFPTLFSVEESLFETHIPYSRSRSIVLAIRISCFDFSLVYFGSYTLENRFALKLPLALNQKPHRANEDNDDDNDKMISNNNNNINNAINDALLYGSEDAAPGNPSGGDPASAPSDFFDTREDNLLGCLYDEEEESAGPLLYDDDVDDLGLDVIFEEEEDASHDAAAAVAPQGPAQPSAPAPAPVEAMEVEDVAPAPAPVFGAAARPPPPSDVACGPPRTITRPATSTSAFKQQEA